MLSIIIVNYNTSNDIDHLLKSIITFETTYNDYEIIIIDNNSGDKGLKKLFSDYPFIKIINAPRNGGFAYGNNLGINKSSGDIILLLNPDTYLEDNSINKLYNRLSNDPHIDFIGPKLLYPNGKNQSYYLPKTFLTPWRLFCETFFLNRIFPTIKIFNSYYRTYMNYNNEAFVEQISGAAFMFKKSVINKIGLLDDNFFMYYEESDYCFQAVKNGFKLLYYPQSVIIHSEGSSQKTNINAIPKLRIKWEIDSFKYYFKKNFSKQSYYFSVVFLIMLSISRGLLSLIRHDNFFKNHLYKIYKTIY